MLTQTVSENPVNDLSTHTLYVTTSAVNLLPLRRQLTASRKLKELVILPHHLRPSDSLLLLLRVKHVALDYTTDFLKPKIVPGSRIIGKIALKSPFVDKRTVFQPDDKLFVFPHSACWIQAADDPCENCIALVATDSGYEAHKQYPCLNHWEYGKTVDGGLQDYVRVPQPTHTLMKIPELVSLHDCCFLLDIALPFFSYCKDVLLDAVNTAPHGRILVILNDSAREANDCLLVIHHLRLDHSLITFTDMRKLQEVPGLAATYAHKFNHVLVFALGDAPVMAALALGISTGLESTKSRYTVGLFANGEVVQPPADRAVNTVRLSYKDRFLMEELLETLADFNRQNCEPQTSCDLIGSNDLESTHISASSESSHSVASTDTLWLSRKSKRLRFKDEAEIMMVPKPARNRILWLRCDRDYRLCLDDQCDHNTLRRCQSTSEINVLLQEKCGLRRVFYTNRPASHVKINAFIFAGT